MSFKTDIERNLELRTKIRAEAKSLVIYDDKLLHETLFLFSIFNYFLRCEAYHVRPRNMVIQARRILDECQDAVINTPSSAIYSRLSHITTIDAVITLMHNEIDTLDKYWRAVIVQYAALKKAAATW